VEPRPTNAAVLGDGAPPGPKKASSETIATESKTRSPASQCRSERSASFSAQSSAQEEPVLSRPFAIVATPGIGIRDNRVWEYPLKSGFVAILGRPNARQKHAGSTPSQRKVAIVSAKPQTTRNRIAGVVEVPALKGQHPAAQIVFVDTPGVHKPGSHLDRRMLQEVYEALEPVTWCWC